MVGLLAAVVLLWVDAGQRTREATGDKHLTWRERIMLACLIFGLAMGAFSCLCGALMALVQAIQFIDRL
jgi:hypothetical protein